MAKKKIDKITFRAINGVQVVGGEIVHDVYWDGYFFCYVPVILQGLIATERLSCRKDKVDESTENVEIIVGKIGEIQTALYRAYEAYYNGNLKENKVISFAFKFNSSKAYLNHKKNISFADTPALSLWWQIYYYVELPDGREKIFSAPYKEYGKIVSHKFATDVNKFGNDWIVWTDEREKFFQSITDGLEDMIERIDKFFSADLSLIENIIDNKSTQKLIE